MSLSEFEKHKALKSFDQLFGLMYYTPLEFVRLVHEKHNEPPAYPTSYAAIHIIGIMTGMSIVAVDPDWRPILNMIYRDNEPWLKNIRPKDVLGSNRIWGRT